MTGKNWGNSPNLEKLLKIPFCGTKTCKNCSKFPSISDQITHKNTKKDFNGLVSGSKAGEMPRAIDWCTAVEYPVPMERKVEPFVHAANRIPVSAVPKSFDLFIRLRGTHRVPMAAGDIGPIADWQRYVHSWAFRPGDT
jgi:hypothetical protein